MKGVFIILIICISCGSPKTFTNSPIQKGEKIIKSTMPIWIDYSKNTPDSIKAFVNAYFKTKGKQIITMKEALDMFFEQERASLQTTASSGEFSEDQFIRKIDNLRKPLCNFLAVQLNNSNDNIDTLSRHTIQWLLFQKPGKGDDIPKKKFNFINNIDDIYMQWKAFADTILISGLLK